MHIEILAQDFAPWDYLRDYEANHLAAGQYGATAVFVGTMRDFNQGDRVTGMTLEHYLGMTERELKRIATEAMQQWSLDNCLIVHRVGYVQPNEPIVLLAVWSAHRAAAFDASRFLMEELKSRAPFWKQEVLAEEGVRWVEKNTPDPGAPKRK